jgi:protein TonB
MNTYRITRTAAVLFSLLLLPGCTAMKRSDRHNEKNPAFPEEKIEVVSNHIDTPPEPVGGLAAIQDALNEPEEVWKGNKEGWVIIEATINSNGRVGATKVVKSSGYSGMDTEAMLAVARVAWKPAQKKGQPVTVTVHVPVVFERE